MRLIIPTTDEDFEVLAIMNQNLIVDEGHTYRLTFDEVRNRMSGWLNKDYHARIFRSDDDENMGYALWIVEPDHLFLRQFYIAPLFRRNGWGTKIFQMLVEDEWQEHDVIRLDVLERNAQANSFWVSLGFGPYARTLQLNRANN